MEIAGKGQGLDGENGEPIGDEIEVAQSQTPDQQNECVECETEKLIEELVTMICNLQESMDTELTDENIEFAVELFMEQMGQIPGREVGKTDHHHTGGVKRDERGKIESLLRNFEAGYIKRKYAQAQDVINPPGTPPEELIPVKRSEVLADLMKTTARRMHDELTP